MAMANWSDLKGRRQNTSAEREALNHKVKLRGADSIIENKRRIL